jgi:nucleoside-diphosphate-sugar epimerase
MAKRVFLITGAGGFVGANVCRRLVENGEEVHALVRPSTSLWRIADIRDRLHLHQADICDAPRVDEAVKAIRPTIIYHLATRGAYPHQNDEDSILLTNVFGLRNLFRACEDQGFELFVNTGSSSEYGRKAYAMRENDILEPDSYYAVAKAAQSLLSRLYARLHDCPIVTLRLFSVYGPFEEPSRLIPRLITAAANDRPVDMASRRTARDFVFVEDVVDTFVNIDPLLEIRSEILNVGTGVQSSLQDVVETIEQCSGCSPPVRWGHMEPRPWDSEVWVADVSKLRHLTGNSPRTTLREGLAKTWAWYQAHPELYEPGGAAEC